jgi:hypothetical protein
MEKNVLPRAYVNKFALAQYSAPPLSGPLIIQTFIKQFGKTPPQIFDTFKMNSTNAASIGQVHEATLNGKKLAVKIQYPGAAESIKSDLTMVKPIAFRLIGLSEKEFEKYYNQFHEQAYESILDSEEDILKKMVAKSFNYQRLPAPSAAAEYTETVPHPKYKIKRLKESSYNPDFLKSPDGRIKEIENETGIRFPFSVGQILNRNVEVWACNNNFLMDGKDMCPEEKVFGIRKKDIPQGHELRMMFPGKFRN